MDTNGTDKKTDGNEYEEQKIIKLQTAVADSREAKIEATRAGIRKHLKKFQAQQKTLTEAALTFREQTSISSGECRDIINALQALRKQTNTCLEFLNSDQYLLPGVMASYFSATASLSTLDGEKTARLILEMDLFQSLVISTYNESLSHARQRIDMHVALQKDLKKETKELSELIGHLEHLLVAVPLPPVPCQTK